MQLKSYIKQLMKLMIPIFAPYFVMIYRTHDFSVELFLILLCLALFLSFLFCLLEGNIYIPVSLKFKKSGKMGRK